MRCNFTRESPFVKRRTDVTDVTTRVFINQAHRFDAQLRITSAGRYSPMPDDLPHRTPDTTHFPFDLARSNATGSLRGFPLSPFFTVEV
jgi:hypothetical protein